jgi:hypothetical protein
MKSVSGPARGLFVATILAGSFLLFLVQPMVARMALPRLGGAPNVWNSAMLVYQALLLGGYYYAHRLSRLPLERQARIHLFLYAVALVTLPVGLIDLPSPGPGTEVFWVPVLLALSIGPVFFLVSAQATLMQRWYGMHPGAGEPWALYAASNMGSFAGLIAYPLVVEQWLSVRAQAWLWTGGYVLLIGLIALCARARLGLPTFANAELEGTAVPVPKRTIWLWIGLAAVPSGLMLSTTTHLTTDIFAMPLLWVIPLGLYLLSFVVAFAGRRGLARVLGLLAWPALFTAGTMAMVSQGSSGLLPVAESLVVLFLVSVALHARLYDERPEPANLTLFYLAMSAGGAIGGAFTALIAPLAFDWAWEHPLLILAAVLLLPRPALFDWQRLAGLDPAYHPMLRIALAALATFCAFKITSVTVDFGTRLEAAPWVAGLAAAGLALSQWRRIVFPILLVAMLAQGGFLTIAQTSEGLRKRSYFGIYTIRDVPEQKLRIISHGTTLHGQQSQDPALRLQPLSYYGPTSGAGLTLANAQAMFGPGARIGVVGLGAGSLACYNRPGETFQFFEIDPLVLSYSQDGTFTFVRDCAPNARITLGDARLELAKVPKGSFDILAIDAFSSDSIPLHLLTIEAMDVYDRALAGGGILLIHTSNRFMTLEPVIAANARARGLSAVIRKDAPDMKRHFTPSNWIALSRDPTVLKTLVAHTPEHKWDPIDKPTANGWTDDHASILPQVRWKDLFGAGQ